MEQKKNWFRFSLTDWLASKSSVSFTLLFGIVFLIVNYQGVIYRSNPDNTIQYHYPFAVQVFLSHFVSLFFGLATAIIIIQSKNFTNKVIYCIMETIMIFLNLNRNIIDTALHNSQFFLGTYVAIFTGYTLYSLGELIRLSKIQEQSKLNHNKSQEENLTEIYHSQNNHVVKNEEKVELVTNIHKDNEAIYSRKLSD